MSQYQFATSDGKIITEDYNRNDSLSSENVLQILNFAFKLFPFAVSISKIDNFEDIYHVSYPNDQNMSDLYICGKGTTPGGRSGLANEQRIQTKSKNINYIYEICSKKKKGILLGIYSRNNSNVLCAWKVSQSSANSPDTPISKQVKIESISEAIKEGFVQQDKGKGEYACIFKPEFLYFYLKNSNWLHGSPISELAMHTAPLADDYTNILNFYTHYITNDKKLSHNRIVFGAPGTGKSFLINKQRRELLKNYSESNYERVTFHPEYSYANFVGTYKPVMTGTIVDESIKDDLKVLKDPALTAQEKYDTLFQKFKDAGHTRSLAILVACYSADNFTTRLKDGELTGEDTADKNIGQFIKNYFNPLSESGDISYKYVPGPFMRMYVKALKNAQKVANKEEEPQPFLLIIEEINRANVAAVFGDIFQLLDRDDDNVSEYPIQASEDIKKYLAENLGGDPEDYAKIKIPDNLFIWATMNSADQGVFPMDTAFKRRWDFTYLGIDDNDENLKDKFVLLGKENPKYIEWNSLRKAINEFLANEKINEDKQLGPYFIAKDIVIPTNGIEIDKDKFNDVFKHKVLMYLFDDAAKQKRSKLFEGVPAESSRYSKICKAFEEKGIDIFHSSIREMVTTRGDLKEEKDSEPLNETEDWKASDA